MPKATAIWLIENTSLTFSQIATFSGLHVIEVQAIANGEAAVGMVGFDPIASSQLTLEEIKRCEENTEATLVLKTPITPDMVLGKKKRRYTPLIKRQDRPNGIAWVLKFYPNLSENKICALLGTTKTTIQAIKNKTHWNHENIKPKNPVQLGLCSQADLEEAINSIKKED